ncbi:unnamed protein product [Cunninghamella echinulata]
MTLQNNQYINNSLIYPQTNNTPIAEIVALDTNDVQSSLFSANPLMVTPCISSAQQTNNMSSYPTTITSPSSSSASPSIKNQYSFSSDRDISYHSPIPSTTSSLSSTSGALGLTITTTVNQSSPTLLENSSNSNMTMDSFYQQQAFSPMITSSPTTMHQSFDPFSSSSSETTPMMTFSASAPTTLVSTFFSPPSPSSSSSQPIHNNNTNNNNINNINNNQHSSPTLSQSEVKDHDNISMYLSQNKSNSSPVSVSNSELRRQIHIQSEQKRRAQIKDGFEDLRNELPSCLNKKMSKVTLLHQTVQHIQHLKSTQATILAELERLMNENVHLKRFQESVLQKQSHSFSSI